MRLLVCGGRDFEDRELTYELISKTLGSDEKEHHVIIHGGAKGADTLAGDYAKENGLACEVYHAEWERFGKAAGAKRNRRMLVEGKPNAVLAMPGGRGTANMVKQTKSYGVPVYIGNARKSNYRDKQVCPSCGEILVYGEDIFGEVFQCEASDCLQYYEAEEILGEYGL